MGGWLEESFKSPIFISYIWPFYVLELWRISRDAGTNLGQGGQESWSRAHNEIIFGDPQAANHKHLIEADMNLHSHNLWFTFLQSPIIAQKLTCTFYRVLWNLAFTCAWKDRNNKASSYLSNFTYAFRPCVYYVAKGLPEFPENTPWALIRKIEFLKK